MNILVTGASGFIGSNLLNILWKRLSSGSIKIFATGRFDKYPTFPGMSYLSYGPFGINWDQINKELKGECIDQVIHLAANNDTTCDDDSVMTFDNVISSLEIFVKCVSDFGCKKIIYASTTAIYGNGPIPYVEQQEPVPLNAYARSKLQLEAAMTTMAKECNIRTIGLRFCNVYGPGEYKKGRRASMVYQMAKQMPSRPPKLFRDGNQRRDYIYVDDAVRLINLCSMADIESCIMNCGSGVSTSFNELFEILKIVYNKQWPSARYVDNPYESAYQSHTCCNMSLAKKLLGFVPKYDITTGIRDYINRGIE